MDKEKELNQREAIFGFCAWVAADKEKMDVLLSKDKQAIHGLMCMFCDMYKLPEITDTFIDKLAEGLK